VESRNTALRTVDVARRAGCSVQHVRNLEQAGALPPTTRTPAGYRTYTHVHVLAAAAYVTLSAGVGPVQAKTILRTAHRSPLPELLDALDAAHAGLHNERRVVHRQHALTAISAEPIHAPRADDAMTISELAGAPPQDGPAPTARSTYETHASSTSYASPATVSRPSDSSWPRSAAPASTATSLRPSPLDRTTSPNAHARCSVPPPSWNR